jgi:hypothetical protein
MNDVFGEALQKLSSVKPQLALRETLNHLDTSSDADEPVVLQICPNAKSQEDAESGDAEVTPLMIFRPAISDLPDADGNIAQPETAIIEFASATLDASAGRSCLEVTDSPDVQQSVSVSSPEMVIENKAVPGTECVASQNEHTANSLSVAQLNDEGPKAERKPEELSAVKEVQVESAETKTSEAATTNETSQQTLMPPAEQTVEKPVPLRAARRPLLWIQENRRRTAAIVILLCMGLVLSDDGSDTTESLTSDEMYADELVAESLLSEFDATYAQPTKEPADPVDASSQNDLLFTIPTPAASEHDQSTAQMQTAPPVPSSEFSKPQQQYREELTRGAPAWNAPGERSSSQSDDNARAVKFTGRIAPLK